MGTKSATLGSGGLDPSDQAKLNSITVANIPSSGEKSALGGTNGTPGVLNQYVTSSDPRNSDSRDPTAHASDHISTGTDVIPVAVPSGASGLLSGAWAALLNAATSAATALTIVLRDAAGRFKAANPDASDDVDTKGARDAALAGKLQFSFGANAVGVGTTSVSWMEAGMGASVGLQSTPRGHIALVDCDIYAATETCGTRDKDGGSTGTVLYAVFVDNVDSTKGLSVNLNTTAGVGIAMTPVTLGSVISVNAGQHIACLPRRVGAGMGRSNCTVTYYARAR